MVDVMLTAGILAAGDDARYQSYSGQPRDGNSQSVLNKGILSPERRDCTLGVILFLAGLSNQGQVVVGQILDTLCPRLWLAGLSDQG